MNKLTRKHILGNKKKTIVTILGIIISVSMLTAVSTGVTSVMRWLENRQITRSGAWHVEYNSVSMEQLAVFEEDSNVEKLSLMHDVGYAKLDGSINPYKPYVYVTAYDDTALNAMAIHVTEGRLPQTETEIVISDHILSNGGVEYKVGDQVTYEFGERYATYDVSNPKMEISDIFYMGSLGQKQEYLGQIEEVGGDPNPYVYEKEDGTLTITGEELRLSGETKSYTIVGIMERPFYAEEDYSAPGYSVYTFMNPSDLSPSDKVRVRVYQKKVNSSFYKKCAETAKQLGIMEEAQEDAVISGTGNVRTNQSVLYYRGITGDKEFNLVVIMLSGILVGIIMIGSVSLIYNSFAISISERSKQLGMLSSVGATKKQKRNAVFYEAFLYGIIGIPIGIVAGILGLKIAFFFVAPMIIELSGVEIPLTMYYSSTSLVTSVLLSGLTIFISCYLPAKRASKISAMDAIRQSKDIKLTAKRIKTSWLTKKIFGLPGEIAVKNMKRNKKRYRSLILSLFISVVLFISVGSYIEYTTKAFELQRRISNYDYSIGFSPVKGAYELEGGRATRVLEELRGNASVKEATLSKEISIGVLSKEDSQTYIATDYYEYIKDVWEQQAQRYGEDGTVSLDEEVYKELEATLELATNIIALDDASFEAYCDEVGVNPQELESETGIKGILINRNRVYEGMAMKEYDTLQIKPGEEFVTTYQYGEGSEIITYHVQVVATTSKLPMGYQYSGYYGDAGNLIVSQSTMERVLKENFRVVNKVDPGYQIGDTIYMKAAEEAQLEQEVKAIIDQYQIESWTFSNEMAEQQNSRQLVALISVFAYGFITLMSLICCANMINTINTSISLRRKEFAMLKSVGMTPNAFQRMIIFESLFYGVKALLYGLPVSTLIAYGISHVVDKTIAMSFYIPWKIYGIAIVFVFVVVGLAMAYATSKVRKENIIEGLKSEIF